MASTRADLRWMKLALQLAARARGSTSPNPMVGAVLVRGGRVVGRGYHRKAGLPHAEVEALRDAERRGESLRNATLFVTLEPCSTHGRTPPCTEAILKAGIRKVVVAATDPNPKHAGRGLKLLRKAGVRVTEGLLAEEATRLNEAFNHWIVTKRPFVILKSAMTLDGKIATRTGESKWITSEASRAHAMGLRYASDAILVGVNTVLADDPELTLRPTLGLSIDPHRPKWLRIVLDSRGRTPLTSKLLREQDGANASTILVVTRRAPASRLARLRKRAEVWVAPTAGRSGRVSLPWVLDRLGRAGVTRLLVEGGGEVHGAFVTGGHVQRTAFYYAPKVVGGRESHRAVAGVGAVSRSTALQIRGIEWLRIGADLFVTGRVEPEP